MALFDAFNKKSILKSAIKQTAKARASEGAKAEQLFLSAYQGFASVVKGDLLIGEALYNWGFALLHQAKSKTEEDAVKIYLDAIAKFTFCLLVTPSHLGAAIDGGVAYMDLARIVEAEPNDELYDLAKEFFDKAEHIQRGSAAYNFACLYGLRNERDACLQALELAKESGSLPDIDEVLNDADMRRVKSADWFVAFVEKVKAGPEPVIEDENVKKYDAEGNVVRKKVKKQPEYEVDGIVYDVEGNVLRRVDDEAENELVIEADVAKSSPSDSSEQPVEEVITESKESV